MCLENDACYGVNFQKQDGICEIDIKDPDGHEEAIDSTPSWTAYLRLKGKCYTYLFYTNNNMLCFPPYLIDILKLSKSFFHYFI
jgi:hypothetical protein